MQNDFFAAAPLWLLMAVIFVGLSLSALTGIALRGRVRADPDDDASEGYLLSATLALLGLLIGFTFSMTLNRYDTRRRMVVEEANAIGTTWLRAGLVEGEPGATLRPDLRAYARLRLQLPQSEDANAAEAASGVGQAQVWADVRAALPTLQPPIAATLLTATNDMFDAASSRRAEREARVPGLVLDILVASGLLAAGIVGYVLGKHSGRRHRLVTAMLFLLLTLAITLILDLDRPWSGFIRVPQEPMEQTVAGMR